MNRTGIEWCDSTVNPIRFRNLETGRVGHYCEKISPGCTVTIRTKYEDVPIGDGLHHRMFPVGKKSAGRLLDGQVWDQRPEGWG
jgi:protein gp37